jgi:uncharacterized protein (DUF1778 family)
MSGMAAGKRKRTSVGKARARKTKALRFRLTADDKARFERAAVRVGLSVSSWIVSTALREATNPGKHTAAPTSTAKKAHSMQVRVTPQQRSIFKAAAKRSAMKLTDWLVTAALREAGGTQDPMGT